MKRFLVCGGLHGSAAGLAGLGEEVTRRRPDGLLFAGGVLAPDRPEETAFLERFFRTLGELDVFTAVLPGPGDAPLEDFLRLGLDAEQEYPSIRLAHARLIAANGLAVSGIGGCLLAEGRPTPDSFSRVRIDYFLRALDLAEQPRKVLMLSACPLSLGGGADGRLIDALIRSHAADLCVVAGPTPHRGLRRVGRTLVVNPGCLADGSAAWVDWRRHPGGHVEFLDRLAPALACAGPA